AETNEARIQAGIKRLFMIKAGAVTSELPRPRSRANSNLDNLHAKYAIAARVQRFVRRRRRLCDSSVTVALAALAPGVRPHWAIQRARSTPASAPPQSGTFLPAGPRCVS